MIWVEKCGDAVSILSVYAYIIKIKIKNIICVAYRQDSHDFFKKRDVVFLFTKHVLIRIKISQSYFILHCQINYDF